MGGEGGSGGIEVDQRHCDIAGMTSRKTYCSEELTLHIRLQEYGDFYCLHGCIVCRRIVSSKGAAEALRSSGSSFLLERDL